MGKPKTLEEDVRDAFDKASKKDKYKILLDDPLNALLDKAFKKPLFKKKYKKLPKDFYNSNEWAEMRIKILKRDGVKCIHCGNPANHVDHINSAFYFPEMALDPNNLISSCESCHKKRQPRGKWK